MVQGLSFLLDEIPGSFLLKLYHSVVFFLYILHSWNYRGYFPCCNSYVFVACGMLPPPLPGLMPTVVMVMLSCPQVFLFFLYSHDLMTMFKYNNWRSVKLCVCVCMRVFACMCACVYMRVCMRAWQVRLLCAWFMQIFHVGCYQY